MRVTRKERLNIRENGAAFREYLMHLRLEVNDVPELIDDAMGKIEEAFGIAETQTNRVIVPGIVEIALHDLPTSILLPVTPVSEILEIRYMEGDGNAALLPPEGYALIADEWKTELHLLQPVALADSGHPEKVWITVRAGYQIAGTSQDIEQWESPFLIPGNIKSAVKLIAGNLFASETDQPVGRSVSRTAMNYEFLLRPWRITPYNKTVY